MNRLDKIQTVRIISLGILALLLAGVYFLVISPRLNEASNIRGEVENAVAANAQTQQRIDNLKASEGRIEEMLPFANRLAGFFPPDANQKVLFRQIKDAGAASGIADLDITSVEPGPPAFGLTNAEGGAQATDTAEGAAAPTAANQIASQTLRITASASVSEGLDLLSRLERLDRSFLISSVSVTSGENGSEVSIEGLMFMLPAPVNPKDPDTGLPEDVPAIPGSSGKGKAAQAVTADEQALITGLVQVPR